MYYEIAGSNVRLLGSMHLWPKSVGAQDLPQWVSDAYEWCERLYLEADPAEAARNISLPAGTTLESLLLPATWSALTSKLPQSVDVSKLNQLKPRSALWALLLLGRATFPGVEPKLIDRAKNSKTIDYLETEADWDKLLQTVTKEDYARAFDQLFKILPGFQQTFEDMYAAWNRRSVEGIEATLPRTLPGLPAVAHLLLDGRNKAWLPKIMAALDKLEKTLIVVGAAHLSRQQGLLELLRREGREVRLVTEV